MSLKYERSIEEALQALRIRKSIRQEDWERLRTPQAQEKLLENASAWLFELPLEVRPRQLVTRFPRIANKLYKLHRIPEQFNGYLDDLLSIRRGPAIRKGFPPQIASELATLKVFYEILHRKLAEAAKQERTVCSTVPSTPRSRLNTFPLAASLT